jgi:hypothetical protein
LRRHRLLIRAHQGAGRLRALAHHLDRIEHGLRFVRIGVAEG